MTLRRALLIGLVIGLVILPFRVTAGYALGEPGREELAQTNADCDRMQELVGAFYYAQDSWRLPLFQAQNLGWPDGTNIVYMDCVPFAALLLKLVNQFHPVLFNYLGLWIAFCFALNPVFFCWNLYELNVRDGRLLAAGAIIASCVPILLFRHGQPALCAQFLILWALALYFRSRRLGFSGRMAAAYAGLIFFTLLVSVYLLVMVWAIYFVALVQAGWDQRLGWRRAAAYFIGTLGGCLAAMFLCGHLTLNQGLPPPGNGFGSLSMNMVSPFWPWHSAFAFTDRSADATGWQYEGYNYLGAGALLLLVIHGVASWREILHQVRRHALLVAILSLLVVAAWSNKVYFWHFLIFQYHFPAYEHIMANFRVSGRFFWPVNYSLLLALVVLTARRFSARTATLLLTGCALLQAYDTHVFPQLGTIQAPTTVSVENTALWENVMAHFSRVEIYPAFDASRGQFFNAFIQYVAARKNLPINSVYNARPPVNTDFEYKQADHPLVREHVIYFFQKSDYSLARLVTVLQGQRCSALEGDDCFLVATALPEGLVAQSGGKLRPLPPVEFSK